MGDRTGGVTERAGDAALTGGRSVERFLEHIPVAFAVTRGNRHVLVHANAAFRHLLAAGGEPVLGRPIADVLAERDTAALTDVLDLALRSGVVARDRRIGPLDASALPMSCTVWPEVIEGRAPEHLVIELRVATQGELALALQQEVAERLLLSALREQDAAYAAEESRRGAAYLATEGRRLYESLDEAATLEAMTGMSLPYVGGWCIVDTRDTDDTMHRLAIVHPDPAKQALLEELRGRWTPKRDDAFGLPAMLRSAMPTVIADEVDAAFAATVQHPLILSVLRKIGVGALLTVPLVIRGRVAGAVTFVADRQGRSFTTEDVELAEDLASRSAMALDRARLYGEAITLRVRAESASEAKSAFLSMMSHELRTPLNAIGGYVDLMDLELHGPVTDAQHTDLARIRTNQRYLTGLISDLLNLTTVGSGQLDYDVGDVTVQEVLEASVALVEPLITQKPLIYRAVECDPGIIARGDREKVIQILVNLLSNAIKFTPPGGRLTIDCAATETTVTMRLSDTGIGIPSDKLEVIFEPFVQVKGSAVGIEGGVGLGLAISRSLAQAMQGDLTVESALGKGACFTLTLPRSLGAGAVASG